MDIFHIRSPELRRVAASLTFAFSGLCVALGVGGYFADRAAEKVSHASAVQLTEGGVADIDITPELLGFGAAEAIGGAIVAAAAIRLAGEEL